MAKVWDYDFLNQRCLECSSREIVEPADDKGLVVHRCLCNPSLVDITTDVLEEPSFVTSNFYTSLTIHCRKNPAPYSFIIKLFHHTGD